MGDVGKGGGVQYEVQDRRRGKREGFVEEERGRKRERESHSVCVLTNTYPCLSLLLHLYLSQGGEMIELMRATGGFHTAEDMANACNQPGGLNKTVIARMLEKLKGNICSVLFSALL
jgi:hypothetical protein